MNRATKTIAVVVTAEALSHALLWAWREMRYQREATAPPATKPAAWSSDSRHAGRLRAGIEALHRPVTTDALMGDHADESCECEDECPTEPVQVCRECARIAEESDPYYGERGLSATLWPCATADLLNPTEGEAVSDCPCSECGGRGHLHPAPCRYCGEPGGDHPGPCC